MIISRFPDSAAAGEQLLTFGQLSVWRVMETYPLERWSETYLRSTVPVPSGTSLERVHGAIDLLRTRHESLRTLFLDGPAGPVQRVMPAREATDVKVVECRDADVAEATRIADEMADPRIDRATEFGHRFAVVTDRGEPAFVALVVDHIVADGFGLNRLRAELAAALGEHPQGARWLAESPPQPRELAAEQRSDTGVHRSRAAIEHWHGLLRTLPADLFPVPRSAGDSPGRIEAILRSPQARSDLAVLSAKTTVSPQNVLLALSALATSCVTRSTDVVLTLQSSNRFSSRWRAVVSSMNQYAPLPVRIGSAETAFADFAAEVERASMRAYLRGSYDIDAITELVRRERHLDLGFDHFYNFMAHDVSPASATPATRFTPGTVEETIPQRNIGPRLDIKVRAGDDMPIVVRTDPALVPIAALHALLRWFEGELHRLATGSHRATGEARASCLDALENSGGAPCA